MNNNRFFVVKDKPSDAAIALLDRGFSELDTVGDGPTNENLVFIDHEKKTFFLSDQAGIDQSNAIIVEKFNQSYQTIDLKTLHQWNLN